MLEGMCVYIRGENFLSKLFFFFFLRQTVHMHFFFLCHKVYGKNRVQLKTSLSLIFLKIEIFEENIKKPPFLSISHLAQKRSTQSLEKKLELERKSFYLLFSKLKDVDFFKKYKSLKLNVEKAYKCTTRRNRQFPTLRTF